MASDLKKIQEYLVALKHPDESIRKNAALVLGQIGNNNVNKVKEALREALWDEKEFVRENAKSSLFRIAPEEIPEIKDLIKKIEKEGYKKPDAEHSNPVVDDSEPSKPSACSESDSKLTGSEKTISTKLPYMGGLDGLRAIAVAAVVFYHTDVKWMPGGFLGVDMFFVISGFLITSLLLVELENTGKIDFKDFYKRRVRRLFPALIVVLITSVFLVAFFALDAASAFKRNVLPALFYVSNWGFIFTNQSYFEFIGRPPMLQHLWSLAIEEQFYLIWPVTTLIAWRLLRSRGILIAAIAGALGSTLLMAWLAVSGSIPLPNDPSRLYFGTDTHSMGVLLGAALSIFWRPLRIQQTIKPLLKHLLAFIGAASFVITVWSFYGIREYSDPLYRGGFLLFSGICGLLIIASTYRGSILGKLLSLQPLRYIGERSYGLYLWHWPLFLVTRPGVDISLSGAPAMLFRLALLIVCADLSYRFIELPIRQGKIGVWRKRIKEDHKLRKLQPAMAFGFVAILIAFAVGPVKLIYSYNPPDTEIEFNVTKDIPVDAWDLKTRFDDIARWNRGCGEVDGINTLTNSLAAENQDDTPSAEKKKIRVSAIGDSVIMGATSALKSVFDISIHATPRLCSQNAVNRALDLNRQGRLAEIVVVHSGNNGPITEKMLTDLLEGLQDRKLVIIFNDREPRRWVATNNLNFSKIVPGYKNARLIDWEAESDDHPDYFIRDGVHLTRTGAKRYSELIIDAVTDHLISSSNTAGCARLGGKLTTP